MGKLIRLQLICNDTGEIRQRDFHDEASNPKDIGAWLRRLIFRTNTSNFLFHLIFSGSDYLDESLRLVRDAHVYGDWRMDGAEVYSDFFSPNAVAQAIKDLLALKI
jgi:hypothetical protein